MWSRDEFADPSGALGLQINRELLADGVVGLRCTYAGDASDLENEQVMEASFYLRDDEELGSIEVYEHGVAMNIFVTPRGGGTAVGVIKYRPDPE